MNPMGTIAGGSIPSVTIAAARRPRVVAIVAIAAIVAAAWLYLIEGPMVVPASGGDMSGMSGMANMPGMEMSSAAASGWGWKEGFLLFVMWGVMMVAMMLPSAAPMILIFSGIGTARAARGEPPPSVAFFAAGYLAVWWAFSAVAALIQWTLHDLALLSSTMRTASPVVSASILIAAGVYQWLPAKQSCLAHCRSPLGFFTASWREGRHGAMTMGISHGAFCVGCCWMLMALLFVAGVMNLAWVALLSVVVLLEKTVPAGPLVARVTGALMIVAGGVMLVTAGRVVQG
jgi:predicted metal-binding membrane protein